MYNLYFFSDENELHKVLRDKFLLLIKHHFIQRCPEPKEKGKAVPDLKLDENDLYK